MTMPVTDVSVRKSVTVEMPVDDAFRLFTKDIDRWWIRGHHIGTADLDRVVLEGWEGGRWHEIGVDGSECDWGHVVAWDPPGRVVLAWQLDATWHFDADLERFGEAVVDVRTGLDSPGGWQGLLDRFATAASS
jgi:hypothetical protein